MSFTLTSSRVAIASVSAFAVLSFAGCGDGDGLGPDGGPSLTQEITFEEFQDLLNLGETVRVEIELLSEGPLIAREIEIEEPDEIADEEEIESRIVSLDVPDTDCEGTATLALGGLEIGFSAATTEFEGDDDGDLACEEFVSRVQDELGMERQPAVEAERQPLMADGSIVAQAPDDGTFDADELELEGDDDEAEIEINIDADNLGDCSGISEPDCLGTLRVLDLVIVITSDTELEQEIEDDDDEEETEFEGIVESVELDSEDPDQGSVTLADGRIVRIVAGTEIKNHSGNDDRLRSLTEVKEAVDAGKIVEAEAEGVLDTTDPSTLVASEAEFELEDDD